MKIEPGFKLKRYRFKDIESQNDSSTPSESHQNELISKIGERFNDSMQILWKFMYGFGGIAEATTHRNWVSFPILVNDILERTKNTKSNETPIAVVNLELDFDKSGTDEIKTEQIKLEIFEQEHLKLLNEHSQFHSVALEILNETALQQLINIQEKMIADIVKWRLGNQLTTKGKNDLESEQINYRDILSFKSLEELKSYIIDNKVVDILSKDLDDQIKFISDEFKVDYKSQFKRLDLLKETLLIRHAIVHSGGVDSSVFF